MFYDKVVDYGKRFTRKVPVVRQGLVSGYRLLRKIPIVGSGVFKMRWRDELKLIGGDDPSNSNKKSIIHFTLNRSASQFIKRVLSLAIKDKKMMHVDWSKMAGHSEYPYLDHLEIEDARKYSSFFRKRGYLYSHFGGYVRGISDIEEYKVILVVRDPRDLVVSNYYSTLHSHILPVGDNKRKKVMRERELAESMNVKNWARRKADYYKERYQEYIKILLSRHKNVHISRFEDMISEFEGFVGSILDYCKLNISEEKRKYILELMKKEKPKGESKKARNRKGEKDDYKDKLDEETVYYLNNKFKEELEKFGYSRNT